jgi:adenylyltransferase/sulfurtransferase
MSEKDWELIHDRRSCNLLSRDEMQAGHVPTTPTVGSTIAGLQVQQALKYLHGLDAQPGRGLYLNGLTYESHTIEYQRDEECFAHEHADQVCRLPWRAADTTVDRALSEAEDALGGTATLELRNDIVVARHCTCGFTDEPYSLLLRMDRGAGVCPHCGDQLRLDSIHALRADTLDRERSLFEVGIAEYDIIRFRRGTDYWNVLLDGDRPAKWPRESGQHFPKSEPLR